jgi:hypothetical protein
MKQEAGGGVPKGKGYQKMVKETKTPSESYDYRSTNGGLYMSHLLVKITRAKTPSESYDYRR